MIERGELDCVNCKEVRPLREFCKGSEIRFGYSNYCALCRKQTERGTHKKPYNAEKAKAATYKYRAKQKALKLRQADDLRWRWMLADPVAFAIGTGIFSAVCAEAIKRGHLKCKGCGGIFAPSEMTQWTENTPTGPYRRGRCRFCESAHTKKRNMLEPIKQELRLEQGGLCYYCGEPRPLSIDHKIPPSRGGSHDKENLCGACIPCNSRKGQRTEAEFRAAG